MLLPCHVVWWPEVWLDGCVWVCYMNQPLLELFCNFMICKLWQTVSNSLHDFITIEVGFVCPIKGHKECLQNIISQASEEAIRIALIVSKLSPFMEKINGVSEHDVSIELVPQPQDMCYSYNCKPIRNIYQHQGWDKHIIYNIVCWPYIGL